MSSPSISHASAEITRPRREGSQIDIYKLFDELEALVEKEGKLHIFSGAWINEEKFFVLTNKIRSSLPEEVEKAGRVTRESDRLLHNARQEAERITREANQQAERIITDATERAARMVDESEIVAQAQQHASEIQRHAEAQADEIRRGADGYALDILSKMDAFAHKVLEAVDSGRHTLHQPSRDD